VQRLRRQRSGCCRGVLVGVVGDLSERPAPLSGVPDPGNLAVVFGAQGGIGAALCHRLRIDERYARVLAGSRRAAGDTDLAIDITDESSIEAAAATVEQRVKAGGALRLVVDATGFLHGRGFEPEKSIRQIDAAHMAHAFAVNAIGPALLMKHFLPLLSRSGRSVFATLSAKVGSIGDNHLGGWYSYRASKAALNQLVHTAAIELARRQPQAICVALHPGTVDTGLSSPFAKSGLDLQTPDEAAQRLLSVIDALTPTHSGGFFNHRGEPLPW
jgi:NAD(P)-dependent dehydrogenase (short-subunit alcohol dehydrogenase family)